MTQNLPTLTVIGGPLDGATLRLEAPGERRLGSGASCALQLQLANIAPEHARLVWDARGLVVSDAGSETGTYVNGERLVSERVLADGDRVFLGPPGSKNTAKLLATGVPVATGVEPVMLDLESEPVVVHDPEPVLAQDPQPAPSPPPAPPPPTPTPAAAPRPEYTTGLPSIAPADRVREELPLPPAPAPVRARVPVSRLPALPLPAIPRAALIAAGTAVLAGGSVWFLLSLRQPPPLLNSVAPPRIEPGQTLTLAGSGFGATTAQNEVRIGDQKAAISSASQTQIAVVVPEGVEAGEAQVRVEREGRASNPLFVKIFRSPHIESLDPDVAQPGAEVVARGRNLGEGAKVVVGAQEARVLEARPDLVRFQIPADVPSVPGQAVPVHLRVGTDSAKPVSLYLGQLPYLVEVSPSRGQSGDRVVLKGRGFDPDPAANHVMFGDRLALVLQASASELAVAAPGGADAAQSDLPVVVRARGRASASPLTFTLVRPSLGTYTPRYFPEPAPGHAGHDHAIVACELGPVLLLSGNAGAPSTAERAGKLAASLNALPPGGRVSFEVRERPATGVGVAGSAELLVAVTAEDVQGYGEPWSGAAARTPTPQRLAAYWAALLQDHRLLFFERDRPIKVLELSPRGKALSDLYAEAVRRSGPGQGVPASLVGTLNPRLVRELREMALTLPASDSGSGAAAARAVEGLWQGVLQEPGAPDKPINVRLSMEGSQLGGTLTTRVGRVAMDVPLRDVSYDRGQLRFTLVSGGAPRIFSGTLQGDTLSGTTQAPGKEPSGRFTLKYQQ